MVREKGKGGLRHQELQKLLADHFMEQGKISVVEAFIGKNVDILVNDADKTIAVEIQLSPKHCLQIKEDFNLGCDEVWIVCESSNVLDNIKNKVQHELDKTLYRKTKFYLITDFLPYENNKNNRIRRNKIAEESRGIKF